MYNRGQIAHDVYQRLNKSAATPGFYTAEKVNSAIQEAVDFVATEMMLADEGWLKKIDYLDVEANQITIPIPPHIEMIEEIRYLVGNVYVPLAYDTQWRNPQWSVTSGATNLPAAYRIVDNKLYFNPPLGVGGSKYLQIEYMRYPSILRNDAQQLDPQFGRAFTYYITYRAMSILASAMKQNNKSWENEEAMWYEKMLTIANRRNASPTPIKEFVGW
jgi:hypothetical protein